MLLGELEEKIDVRSQAEELAQIAMQMQRCLFGRLSREISQGSVSFPQFFLLTYLDQRAPITMSDIAARMGHSTAAATGLVDRQENVGVVTRAQGLDDSCQVMLKITPKRPNLRTQNRQAIIDTIDTL